jgi:hypothetical protein
MEGMNRKAIWLAICLGFDSGPRIGNVTLKDGKCRETTALEQGTLHLVL